MNLDLGLGFKWNYWVKEGSNLLTLKFAWEQHLYTNMNQFQVLNIPLESGFDQNNVKATAFGPSIATTRSDRNLQRGDLSLSGLIVFFSLSDIILFSNQIGEQYEIECNI